METRRPTKDGLSFVRPRLLCDRCATRRRQPTDKTKNKKPVQKNEGSMTPSQSRHDDTTTDNDKQKIDRQVRRRARSRSVAHLPTTRESARERTTCSVRREARTSMSHTRSISHAHDANESIGCFHASSAFAASAHREKVSAAAASRSAYLVGMETNGACARAAPREAHTHAAQTGRGRGSVQTDRGTWFKTNDTTHRGVAS